MKRACLTLIAFAAAYAAFAAPIPAPEADFVLRTRAPKFLFSKLAELFRKIYPDPQLEMRASLALMNFGYPDFKGISTNDCAVVCGFNTDSEKPVYVVGIKMQPDSRIAEVLQMQKLKVHTKGDFSFLPVNAEGVDAGMFIEYAHGAAIKKTTAIAEVEMAAKQFDTFTKGAFAAAVPDIESVSARLDDDASHLIVSATIRLKKGSPLYENVNGVRREKNSAEAAFISQDAEISIILKSILPDTVKSIGKDIFKSFLTPEIAAECESLLCKSRGTFAASINFARTPQILGVSALKAEETKLANSVNQKTAAHSAGDSISADYAAESSALTADRCACAVAVASLGNAKNIYSAEADGYRISASDKSLLEHAAGRIKSQCQNRRFPLKKYASDDSDIVVVVNNKSIVRSLLTLLGGRLKKRADIADSVVTADIARGKIEILARIDIESLNYYGDFYRAINSKNEP